MKIKGKQILNSTITQNLLNLSLPLYTDTLSGATVGYVNSIVSSSGGTSINNYSDNRLLTSDGTLRGINAETKLTYDGTKLNISSTTQNSTVFNIEGTQGQLFSITDTLIGDIFTVSDITGIPILNINTINGTYIYGNLMLDSSVFSYQKNISVTTGSNIISSISNTYDGIFFDYIIKDSSSTNMRTGTVIVTRNGSTVKYSEFSTYDIGNTTPVVLSSDQVSGFVRLIATPSSGSWIIKSIARGL